MTNQTGKILGIIGIIVAIVGFFLSPNWTVGLGLVAIVLGIIGLSTNEKAINWASIILGAIGIIIYFLG